MTDDALTTFKNKLTAGGYAVVTGARRAIGKFRNITDADKAKMHDLANKHFNVLPGKPKGASAPVVAAKPAAKKPAAPAPKALPPVHCQPQRLLRPRSPRRRRWRPRQPQKRHAQAAARSRLCR